MDRHVRHRTPDSGHHVELTSTVSAREAATALGMNERTIRRAIARGDLLATKEAGVFRIKHADLTRYRDYHRIPTAIPVRTVTGPPRLVPLPRRMKGPASDLPSPLTELIGRERAPCVAADLLQRDGVRLITFGVLGMLGLRETASAQVSQAQCGNVVCGSNPGVCKPGCVCCVYSNGNSRCRPPQECTAPGTVATTTTTSAPTTATTAPITCSGDCAPSQDDYCAEGFVCNDLFVGTCIDTDPDGCGGPCRAHTLCPTGCVCNGDPFGTCVKAGRCGCGGGCAPSDRVFCPPSCVCNHVDDGFWVLRAPDGCGEACHPLQGVPCRDSNCVCNSVITGTCILAGPGGCGGACSALVSCPPTCECQGGTCVLRAS